MLTTSYVSLLTLQEKKLPFYVSTIDKVPRQTLVHRPLGIEDYQLLYTVKGCGIAFLDGKTYELKPGMIMFLPPNTAHEYHINSDAWETLYITFGGVGMAGFQDFEPSVWTNPNNFVFEHWHSLLLYYKNNPEHTKELSLTLYAMLLELRESIAGISQADMNKAHILTRAMHTLAESNNPSLKEVASNIGISEAYFCRIFKEYTGYRPFEYMNLLKLHKAKELLKNTNLSVKEISQKVGYDSHSYFSMLFKRYMGITPKEYRQ